MAKVLAPLRERAVRLSPVAFGSLAKHGLDDDASDSYALPCLEDAAVLRDAVKVLRSASQTYVERGGRALIGSFDRPVLFAWAREDKHFSLQNARRYASELAHGHVELIDDAYSFTPEDQPATLARIIAG